jgi:hypothetical protein
MVPSYEVSVPNAPTATWTPVLPVTALKEPRSRAVVEVPLSAPTNVSVTRPDAWGASGWCDSKVAAPDVLPGRLAAARGLVDVDRLNAMRHADLI